MAKAFNLICIIFILFGINISMIWATDCEIFGNAIPHIFDDRYSYTNRFEEKFKKELDCCYIEEINCDDKKNIIGLYVIKKIKIEFSKIIIY